MKKFFILGIVTIISSAVINAQVGINTETLTRHSALQIVSPNEDMGVLMPQISTDNPFVPTDEENGLIFYNTQTGCFNFYNLNYGWMSLCGTPPPAQGSISDCNAIKVIGTYIEKTPTTINNYLQVKVHVIKAGNYSIIAESGNGYFFQASGTFSSAGEFTVNMPALGTPIHANESHVDNLVITFNGIQQGCHANVVVLSDTPDYSITDVVVNPSTAWAVAPANNYDEMHYLTVTLQVRRPGKWSLLSNIINGYLFSGNGHIENASGYNPSGLFPQTVQVQVPVIGKASVYGNGKDNFILSTTDIANVSNYSFAVHLAKVGFSINCGSIGFNNMNNLRQDIALNGNESITLPVAVTSSGETAITAVFGGMQFATGTPAGGVVSSPEEITLSVNTNSVTLYPTSLAAPSTAGDNLPITFASTEGGLNNVCAGINVPAVQPKLAAFANITAIPASYVTPMNIKNPSNVVLPNITLEINANVSGCINITTNTNNGVYYSFSGIVNAGSGTQITMMPTGTPIEFGRFTYTAAYPLSNETHATATGQVTFTVGYAYTAANMLILGNDARTSRMPAFIKEIESPENFGPAGIIPTMSAFDDYYWIAYSDGGGTSASYTDSWIKSTINNNNISVILILNDYDATSNQVKMFRDFVQNKHGVVVDASGYASDAWAEALFTALMENRQGTPATGTSFIGSTDIATYTTTADNPYMSVNHPVLNGPFGDVRGLNFGNYRSGNQGALASAVPANTTVLARNNGQNGRPNIIVHNDWGVIWVADENFTYGQVSATQPGRINSSENANSCNANGKPWRVNYGTSSVNSDTNNGVFVLNMIAWAMDYAQRHADSSVQITY